jgi:hypothetical protein
MPADREDAIDAVRDDVDAHLPQGYEEKVDWVMGSADHGRGPGSGQPPFLTGRMPAGDRRMKYIEAGLITERLEFISLGSGKYVRHAGV